VSLPFAPLLLVPFAPVSRAKLRQGRGEGFEVMDDERDDRETGVGVWGEIDN